MASTSAPRGNGVTGRMATVASTLYSDNQSLVTDIRRIFGVMKDIAVDLEKDQEFEMVKELDNAVIELFGTFDDCTHLSSAIQSVGNEYQPGTELTDFKKLFDNEIAKLKANSSSVPQRNPLYRKFTEAVWNVHHAGQPMPGEEQEDIVMTSTECNLLNITCPISGKPITQLSEPVRSVDCKHIYEKKAVMQYIMSTNARTQCPVAGCPKILQAERVICDPLLPIEIDEIKSMGKEGNRTEVIEDFTENDEEEC